MRPQCQMERERDAWRALAEAYAAQIVLYRTGATHRGGAVADRIQKAKDALQKLGVELY